MHYIDVVSRLKGPKVGDLSKRRGALPDSFLLDVVLQISLFRETNYEKMGLNHFCLSPLGHYYKLSVYVEP